MQQFNNKRFHLIARTKENQDVVLFEFDEDFNFYYYMSQVDSDIYKEAMILECYNGMYPINRMSVEFPDNTPYFEKAKKKVKK
ncbi:MAG: hypothetical protein IJA94_06605 [Bacilli bacterium]|nr:hypothetical protein [Bacilli bacterium]MBQ3415302.1 hypothetical protein [Clostridia bacterium]MBQ6632434.1 hypothetical protein [Romboutsia sp.]MBR0058206.1 hypothetical protein [Methanobrevibacter sp.]MBQ4584541.1 hypothetical protein [Bacilli bacterium]